MAARLLPGADVQWSDDKRHAVWGSLCSSLCLVWEWNLFGLKFRRDEAAAETTKAKQKTTLVSLVWQHD